MVEFKRFFQNDLGITTSVARNLTDATTFALPSVSILLLTQAGFKVGSADLLRVMKVK